MAFFGLSDISFTKDENRKGPLGPLFQGTTSNTFRYPIDIGNYDKGHYMVIHINEQENTQFKGIEQKNDVPKFTSPGSGSTKPNLPNIKEKFSSAINSKIDSGFNSLNNATGGKLSFFKPNSAAFSSKDQAIKTDNANYISDVKDIQRTSLIKTTKRTTDSIALYMPDTLQYTHQQGYEQLDVGNEIAGALATAAKSTVDERQKGNSDAFKNAFGAIKAGVYKGLISALGNISNSPGTAKIGAFLATGGVTNPQLEMIYAAPNFREFNFEFMFYPRDEKEALEVQNIIERLKFHQAPEIKVDAAGILMIPPSEFDIEFYYAGKKNPNLPPITTCILQNISINYAPNGWSAYEMPGENSPKLGRTGMPTAIQMTLDFKETQFLTKESFRGQLKGNVPPSTLG
jgi:hypothetical protein